MKSFFVFFFLGLALIGTGCFQPSRPSLITSPELKQEQQTVKITGIIKSVNTQENTLVLEFANGTKESIHLEESTGIIIDGREEQTLSKVQPEMLAEIFGTRNAATLETIARTIRIAVSNNLVVLSPNTGATVTSPLLIEGFARIFENVYEWRIKDASGAIKLNGFDMTSAKNPGTFGSFHLEIFLPAMEQQEFTLELFTSSPKDGTEENLVSIPLHLLSISTTTFQSFFPNVRLNTEKNCNTVYPVSRTVAETAAVGRTSLYTLLKGPTEQEQTIGYENIFSPENSIYSLIISGGVATVDIPSSLIQPLNTCEQKTLHSQIRETLLQFPSISDVQIILDHHPDSIFSVS